MSPTSAARLSRLLVPSALAASLVLAGCSGSGESSTSSAGGAAGAARVADSSPAAGKAPQSAKASSGSAAAVVGRKLAKQASMRIEVSRLSESAATVRSITVSLRGIVLSEQLGDGSGPPVPVIQGGSASGAPVAPSPDTGNIAGAYAALTLSVPSARLDDAVAQLGRLGKVVSQSSSTQDVTATFIDTQSRLATMRASVERVRALMQRAKDIGQVVTLEEQLSRRQGDLESLQAQLADVQDSVAQSIVSLTLTTPDHAVQPAAVTGFGSGLAAGWHAFTTSVTAVLTVLGAVLPFALVLALLTAPLLWWRRQRAAGGPAPSQPAPSQPAA